MDFIYVWDSLPHYLIPTLNFLDMLAWYLMQQYGSLNDIEINTS